MPHCFTMNNIPPSIFYVRVTELTLGPRPHFLGYVSRSMITRLILATVLWSVVAITAEVICAMAGKKTTRKYSTHQFEKYFLFC